MSGKSPGLIPAGLRRAGDPGGGGGGGGGSVTAADITDATTAGRNMLKAATAAAQRALLSLAAIATSGASADITDATAAGRALLTAADALAQRDALGLSPIAASGFSDDIVDATAAGRDFLTAADAAAQRALLGLAALATSGASADITDATAAGRALLTAATAALQRTALGLATVASSGLASDLTGTIALANGGTGQTTAVAAADALSPAGANIAGAATTDLATVTGPVVTITGTGASITSFGTVAAGVRRRITFASAGSAIIHNATTLICPFGASITVSAGDTFELTSLGSGNWKMTGYLPVNASFWRTALGLSAMASSAIAANITDATTVGRALLTAANVAAQRTALGLVSIASSGLAADITDATAVGRSMLTAANQAAQTALIALATTSLAGLLSASDKIKLDVGWVRIDPGTTLTAATTYTSPTWAAGLYREIKIAFSGSFSGFAYLGFRANNDSGNNYVDIGIDNNTAPSNDSSAPATLGYARCAVSVTAGIKVEDEIHFYPLTDGLQRRGKSDGGAHGSGALNTHYHRMVSFAWTDTATDVTFITLLMTTAATMSGKVQVWGLPT